MGFHLCLEISQRLVQERKARERMVLFLKVFILFILYDYVLHVTVCWFDSALFHLFNSLCHSFTCLHTHFLFHILGQLHMHYQGKIVVITCCNNLELKLLRI